MPAIASGLSLRVIAGVMQAFVSLFRTVLDSYNPFPHGLYWTGIKGLAIPPSVEGLLEHAREKGVDAHHVPIETFDALLPRLWKNIDNKTPELDAGVRKARLASVHIALPQAGRGKPLLRLNALPIIALPRSCIRLSFRNAKEWKRSPGRLEIVRKEI